MSERRRVVVLISGRGSNMSALIGAAMDPSYPAEIVGVVSNRPDAGGLDVAQRYGIRTDAVDHRRYASREAHEEALTAAIEGFDAQIVCLAGYMRLLTPDFTQTYAGRMINIHPSLLPLFPGLHTHERAIEAGMRVHGCTVHFVTAGMDEGPIIAQAAIPVEAGDTPDALAQRLLRAEHRLYPHALRLLAEGAVRLENGRAVQTAERPPVRAKDGGAILISPDARES